MVERFPKENDSNNNSNCNNEKKQTRRWWRLKRLCPEPPPISLVIVKCKFFKLSSGLALVTPLRSHMVLSIGASYCNSAPCLVWCPIVFCRWEYDVFTLSRDLIWPPHWGSCELMGGWDLLALCLHPDKPCDHKQCDCGDVTFLICHMTSRVHMFKGLCEFMGGSPSRRVTTLPCLAPGHWSSASGGWRYLICHVISQDHLIERSSNFMSESSSWYITFFPRLVPIGIVVLEK